MTGFPPQPPQYGAPQPGGFGQPQPQGSNNDATISLVLGILSIICCGFLAGIPAIIFANKAEKSFAMNPGAGSGQGLAKAGKILGIIGTVLSVLGIIVWIGLIALGAASGDFSSY